MEIKNISLDKWWIKQKIFEDLSCNEASKCSDGKLNQINDHENGIQNVACVCVCDRN